MKIITITRTFFIGIFLLGGGLTVSAQDVYNYVLESSTRVVNTPTSNFTNVRIAQFKRTALVYLKAKAFETQEQVTEDFLNTQAYYLSEFVTLFFNELIKSKNDSEEMKKAKIDLFMDASFSNPLFNDSDTETVHAYVKEEGEITPFSLDTDWMKAFVAATVVLEKMGK